MERMQRLFTWWKQSAIIKASVSLTSEEAPSAMPIITECSAMPISKTWATIQPRSLSSVRHLHVSTKCSGRPLRAREWPWLCWWWWCNLWPTESICSSGVISVAAISIDTWPPWSCVLSSSLSSIVAVFFMQVPPVLQLWSDNLCRTAKNVATPCSIKRVTACSEPIEISIHNQRLQKDTGLQIKDTQHLV